MPARAIIAPASFGDPKLPKISLTTISPIAGASADWAADNLAAAGSLSKWYDLVSLAPMAAPSGREPSVVGTTSKAVRFDGVNDWMDATLGITQPVTIALVARHATVSAGVANFLISRGASSTTFNLATDAANTKWQWLGNGATLAGPAKTPDTAFHVFVITLNGATSAINIDGAEVTGNAGLDGTATFRIGASSSGYFNTEYKRVAVIPGAKDAAGREAIRADLAARYGI